MTGQQQRIVGDLKLCLCNSKGKKNQNILNRCVKRLQKWTARKNGLKKIDIKTQNDICEIKEHQLSGFWFDLDSLIKKKNLSEICHWMLISPIISGVLAESKWLWSSVVQAGRRRITSCDITSSPPGWGPGCGSTEPWRRQWHHRAASSTCWPSPPHLEQPKSD